MRRWHYLMIAVRNARGPLPRYGAALFVTLLAAWILGFSLVPGSDDSLANLLIIGAGAAAILCMIGEVHSALTLRHTYPPQVILPGCLCFLLSGWCLWREPAAGVLIRLALPLLLVAVAWFYNSWFSMISQRQRASRVRIGDRFPDFTLANSRGEWITLPSLLAAGPTLFVFYKGDW
jgi:hypothetical protein